MIKPITTSLAALGIAAFAAAQTPTLSISMAVRETGAAGGSFSAIGGDGGSGGGIEWVNRDAQTLTLDGTWQQFSFDLANDPILGFAGTTANGTLEGDFGTIEHIRILNSSGFTGMVELWIDDVVNTITPVGGSPTPNVVSDFEGYADGTEVMFQEPSFSGSTSANINMGSTAGVTNLVASRTPACKVAFQFIDGTATRWVRLTTFNATNLRNPLIRFDQQSQVSFWIRGGVCQADLGFQGPGTAIAEMCGEGLLAGQNSTYYVSGAPANAPGAVLLSLPGGSNLPFLGGTLVSFTNLLFSAAIPADANGRMTFRVNGDSNIYDLVMQTAFIDPAQTELMAYTNAIQARFGQ
jgi:hypothetical protein